MYKFDNRFYADVRIEDRFSTGIMYRNGILESSKTRNEKRAFIRVFDGNIWYYASTSEVKNVQTELNNLYKQARARRCRLRFTATATAFTSFIRQKARILNTIISLPASLRLSRLQPKTILCKICFTTQVRFSTKLTTWKTD